MKCIICILGLLFIYCFPLKIQNNYLPKGYQSAFWIKSRFHALKHQGWTGRLAPQPFSQCDGLPEFIKGAPKAQD